MLSIKALEIEIRQIYKEKQYTNFAKIFGNVYLVRLKGPAFMHFIYLFEIADHEKINLFKQLYYSV